MICDVVVVGGGAAGLTSALYAARGGMKTLLLSEDLGGQAVTTDRIENYPGFEPTDGLTIMHRIRAQAEGAGAEVVLERVEKIEPLKVGFSVATPHEVYQTRSIILAYGLTHRKLSVPGEDRLTGHGVSFCAVCDVPLFRARNVAVVGGGNSAMDAALSLAVRNQNVYLVTRNPELRGERILINRVERSGNVTVFFNARTLEILGDERVTGVRIKHGEEIQTLGVDGVFVEIGYVANPHLIKGLVEVDAQSQIVINPVNNATSRAGIFAAGDITNITHKQLVISAGEGAKAALGVLAYLRQLDKRHPSNVDWTHVVPIRHANHPASSITTQKSKPT